MKPIRDAFYRQSVQFRSGFSSFLLLCLLCLVQGGCQGNEDTKVAQFDTTNGAVKGSLKPVPKGTVVILCRAEPTSCMPLSELSDTISRTGEFVISMVPPGHYVVAYMFPSDLNQGKLPIAEGGVLAYTFGKDLKIEAKMKDGKWRLDKDTSSETHLIAAGAELGFSGSGGLKITNCSVKHMTSGLWVEFRDGGRYESVEVEPGKIAELSLNRWAND